MLTVLLLVMIIASLRNEDYGGIENLSDRFRQAKQQLCTCITLFFAHFSAVVARLQRETA